MGRINIGGEKEDKKFFEINTTKKFL